MSTEPTNGDLLGMPEAADVDLYDEHMSIRDRETADQLHAALTAAGARGSVRLHEGHWFVTLMRGQSRQRRAYPPAGEEHDEWMVAMLDRLEAAAGVRPVIEVEVVETED